MPAGEEGVLDRAEVGVARTGTKQLQAWADPKGHAVGMGGEGNEVDIGGVDVAGAS